MLEILVLAVIFYIVWLIAKKYYEDKQYERALEQYNRAVEDALRKISNSERRCARCKYHDSQEWDTRNWKFMKDQKFCTCYNKLVDKRKVEINRQIGCKYYVPSWVMIKDYRFHIIPENEDRYM